ncbi:uncharacterized protein Bfra_006274 [Botrytis fragariae]|uniref:Yeast cell wall synthesis Kre9/Knh1-like N-terminal domain-containing protein n=1 Tax=Botrytis fragariae TaxID=1964551 RepID=A0A8H6B4I8_9HELO|nr:uncharacterized protein Bfra_006274 [Botrytis fragariae]KAF5879070.1 hypothetical protein Bfra_006274 [Botrytis fragariae]
MRVFHNVSLQLILLAFASLVHSFHFTNTAFNPVLGQQFTITWVDSAGSVTLHLAPVQYYNENISLAGAVSIGVATSGNSLTWTPDNSLRAGVYKIFWVPSDNTQPEIDSPTFTLGQMPAGSSTNTSSVINSQATSTDTSSITSPTEISNPTAANGEAASASTPPVSTQLASNSSDSLTNTIKISISVSIILGVTLIMVIAFILIRRRRYLASTPRTKRQLTTKEIADDNDSWDEERQFKAEVPTESEAATRSYVDLVKKKHVSVNVEPVEMDAYSVDENMTAARGLDERRERRETREMDMGLGLGLGDVEELVEPRELDVGNSGTIYGEGKIGHRFNVRDNVNIIGI